MKFIEKCENSEKYYSVSYDKEILREILEKLKNYSYITTSHCQIAGHITRWPATKKVIEKRVIDSFYNTKHLYPEAHLLIDTITHHKSNEKDYVTYDFSYSKLPDLYDYIDLIVNNRSILDYSHLFGKKIENKTGYLSMLYVVEHWDQLLLEGILNYVNSNELTNHDSIEDDKDYDYVRLNEIYKETLGCFKFKLTAVKEYLKEPETVNVLSLQLKK